MFHTEENGIPRRDKVDDSGITGLLGLDCLSQPYAPVLDCSKGKAEGGMGLDKLGLHKRCLFQQTACLPL